MNNYENNKDECQDEKNNNNNNNKNSILLFLLKPLLLLLKPCKLTHNEGSKRISETFTNRMGHYVLGVKGESLETMYHTIRSLRVRILVRRY